MSHELGTNLSQRAKVATAILLAYGTLLLSTEVAQPADASPAVNCVPAPAVLGEEAGPPTPVALGGNPFKIETLAEITPVSESV